MRTAQSMYVQQRIVLFLKKESESLVKLALDLFRKIVVLLFELSMKRDFHMSVLRTIF